MKYLKTFESHHEDTFDEITCDEYYELIFGEDDGDEDGEAEFVSQQWVDFTPKEFSDISEIIGPIAYNTTFPYTSTHKNSIINSEDVITQIHKINDEWYVVMMIDDRGQADYYKCDQFEGLVDCLKWICGI